MIERVLTVKSTTDWKVRIGGRPASLPPRAWRSICAWSARVSRNDWRAPLIGNELYLKGMNSGTTDSQAARAKGGNTAGQPAILANRAKAVIPIMGEISTSRSALGS